MAVLFVCNAIERNDFINDDTFEKELKTSCKEHSIIHTRLAVSCDISYEYYNRIKKGKHVYVFHKEVNSIDCKRKTLLISLG